jgi:hypothetical protein
MARFRDSHAAPRDIPSDHRAVGDMSERREALRGPGGQATHEAASRREQEEWRE